MPDYNTSSVISTSPPPNKKTILEAIELLGPPPKNPFQIMAKKNGFDLDRGDKMFIHPLDVPHESFDYIHKNLVISEIVTRGNIYFAKARGLF